MAAILRTGNILTATDDDWSSTLDVNLRGSMLVSRAAIRHWVDSGSPGRIVNVTSAAGLEGIPEMFCYSVSKAGVIGLTLATANAVACHDILVNAIAPLAATRMAVRGLGDQALDERSRTGQWPDIVARGLDPARVAPLVEYLIRTRLGYRLCLQCGWRLRRSPFSTRAGGVGRYRRCDDQRGARGLAGRDGRCRRRALAVAGDLTTARAAGVSGRGPRRLANAAINSGEVARVRQVPERARSGPPPARRRQTTQEPARAR